MAPGRLTKTTNDIGETLRGADREIVAVGFQQDVVAAGSGNVYFVFFGFVARVTYFFFDTGWVWGRPFPIAASFPPQVGCPKPPALLPSVMS